MACKINRKSNTYKQYIYEVISLESLNLYRLLNKFLHRLMTTSLAPTGMRDAKVARKLSLRWNFDPTLLDTWIWKTAFYPGIATPAYVTNIL